MTNCAYRKTIRNAVRYLPGWKFDEYRLDMISKDLDREAETKEIYPSSERVLRCFYNLSPIDIKVVILGQDPYHTPGVADGLAFSTLNSSIPPSLQNIFKEIRDDLGISNTNGNLSKWAKQGVLLLNTSLSVEKSNAGSHKKLWDGFTASVIEMLLNRQKEKRVYLLWGKHAQDCFDSVSDMSSSLDNLVLKSAHPSPFSADKGFFGNRHFSKTNEFLKENNIPEIDWRT